MAELASHPTTNATLEAVIAAAKLTSLDRFKVRIYRISPGQSRLIFAAFDDVTVDQLAHPETWLTQLGGGGTYNLMVFHPIDTATQLPGEIMIQAGGPSRPDFDAAILNDPNWKGPREQVFPIPSTKRNGNPNGTTPHIAIPWDGAGGQRLANGDQHLAGAAPLPSSSLYDRERVALDRDREELRRQTLEIEKMRHANELDAERRRQDLEMAKFKAEIAASTAPRAPQGPSELTTLLLEMSKQQQAATERATADQRRADERFAAMMAQMNQATQAQLTAAQESNKMLMQTLLNKPAIDPLMEKMMNRDAEGAATTVKVVQQMAEATGSVVQMMVGALHAVAELNAPEQEPMWMKGLKEAAKAVMAMQTAAPAPVQYVTQAPAQIVPAPAPTAAFGDAPQAAPSAPAPAAPQALPPFQQVVRAIQMRMDPMRVVTYFLDHSEDPSIQGRMQAAQGNPLEAFRPYLEKWIPLDPQNGPYVQKLILTLQAEYEKRMAAPQEEEEDEPLEEAPPAAPAPAAVNDVNELE